MVPGVSLGGFRRVLLRLQLVRVCQMGEVGGLLMVAGLVLFGRHAVVARSLLVVLCRRVVMLRCCSGDRKIRRSCAV
jgi:hypothetical protein